MMDKKIKSQFITNDVGLAAFLILEGVKFLGCKRSDSNPRIVTLHFLDERQNCLDLERIFLNSEHKKYRDITKWLLGKIHEELRKLRGNDE